MCIFFIKKKIPHIAGLAIFYVNFLVTKSNFVRAKFIINDKILVL